MVLNFAMSNFTRVTICSGIIMHLAHAIKLSRQEDNAVIYIVS